MATTLRDLPTTEIAELMRSTVEALADRADEFAINELTLSFGLIGQALGRAASAAPAYSYAAAPAAPAETVGVAAKKTEHIHRSPRSSLLTGPKPTLAQLKAEAVPQTPAPIQRAVRECPMDLFGINEKTPGQRWKALFDATWPAYRAWYLSNDGRRRPDLKTAQAKLAEHMPELIPTYKKLVKLAGNDPVAARMLTLWDPPRFLPGCSQVVLNEPELALVRNYDYSPDLFERVIFTSEFTGRKVIGTSDCLWGLLDGMNDAGFTVSLTFGGLPGSSEGFAIPIVVRYLLEVCDTVAQAREVLKRLPISMAYNLTMVDAAGERMTAFVGPDRAPEFTDAPLATNHRGIIPDVPEHAKKFRSVERRNELVKLEAQGPTAAQLAEAFQAKPLYSDEYDRSFGTLYTAVYRPSDLTVEYIWPDRTWVRSMDDASETISVTLRQLV